jgi:chromosome segregation ATPase
MDSRFTGMDMATPEFYPRRPASAASGLPPVRVEVRGGSARPTHYDVTGEEFLIGSVPGCDLRLPGTNLPPVVCLIARQVDGVRLRKLAPMLPVLVNGQPVSQSAPTPLTHGDCISIGAVDILVAIDFTVPAPVPNTPAPQTAPMVRIEEDAQRQEWARRTQELEARERTLDESVQELEADRVLWYRRREEIEEELKQAKLDIDRNQRNGANLSAAEARLKRREEELDRRHSELDQQQAELTKIRDETLTARRELQERFGEKRGELTRLQDSIRESNDRIRQREEQLEMEFTQRRQSLEADLQQRREQAEKELRLFLEQGDRSFPGLREQIERETIARHRQRAEDLDRFQLGLREAAVQLREKKQQLEEELRQYEPRLRALTDRDRLLDARREELDARAAELQREKDTLSLNRMSETDRERYREQQITERETEIARKEKQLQGDRATIDTLMAQYQADLIRLDRRSVALEQKEKHLQTRAMEIDHRFEQFQRDTRDIEGQILQIDARAEHHRAEDQRQAKQRAELEQLEAKLNERAAQIEGQQVALAALRTRLEHMREQVHAESAQLARERSKLEEHSREAQQKLVEAERLREQVSNEQHGQNDAQRIFAERSEILQQAVKRLRELQQQLAAEDGRLRKQGEELEQRSTQLAERETLAAAKLEECRQQQDKLEAERETLRQREASLSMSSDARELLQDQLRRRSEELDGQQRQLEERARELETQAQFLTKQVDELEKLRKQAESQHREVEGRSTEIATRDAEYQQRLDRLKQDEQALADQRRVLEETRFQWEEEQRQAEEKINLARKEIEALRESINKQAKELLDQVPELEQRTQLTLDRALVSRETLRGQLAEMHAYARQSQEDLETLRGQVQTELENLRQQEASIHRSRSDHRLAVASFRQQLVEWQGRFSEMKKSLTLSENRLDQREKEVEVTSQNLARKVEEVQVQEQVVAEKRGEMDRHLTDMRDWYKKKIRELVEQSASERSQAAGGDSADEDMPILPMTVPLASPVTPDGGAPSDSTILGLADDLDPADRKLGELLRSLELVDQDTLIALWNESRRQHRPLRQVLLNGTYLSLYQLALIESDNLKGLVLDRFHIIDRLQSTSREAIYRVFDPRLSSSESRRTPVLARSASEGRGPSSDDGICILRYLGELEMQDAVHPDEYRQRFTAVRDIAHPNIAATLEVLDINGRPAVVQEALRGLSGSEFPPQAGQAGVWYRLLSQGALGLHTAHQSGLVHGRLTADSFVLTREGTLKITGLGEPSWLQPVQVEAREPSAEDDLLALGRIALAWMQSGPKRKGKKAFPESLVAILTGLGAETPEGVPIALYPSVTALLEELDRVSAEVPADSGAWEKLLQFATDNATEAPLLRQSA